MAIIAHWKEGNDYTGLSKLDAQSCYDELMIISNGHYQNYREIPNQEVVDYARDNSSSELHKAFNWNDFEAAEAFRRHVAKNIKNNLYTYTLENPQIKNIAPEIVEYPVFINPGTDTLKDHAPIEVVMTNQDLRDGVLEKALRELRAFQKRYSFLEELHDVFEAINNVSIP